MSVSVGTKLMYCVHVAVMGKKNWLADNVHSAILFPTFCLWLELYVFFKMFIS